MGTMHTYTTMDVASTISMETKNNVDGPQMSLVGLCNNLGFIVFNFIDQN